MKKYYFLYILLFSAVFSSAQTPVSSGDIYLGLRKLKVAGSVLYIAAHPDDENTRLLTWLSKEKQFRTGYLSLTRGDGGQNLIGDEQGIALGLIRTQELLSARRIDGAEQFFSRAYDFGYSKTPEETFTKWDRETILADVVWVIRKFRPDIIITRFPTTGEGGHGHHTASAILANEAFTAAADPKRFPQQLSFVQPWQAKRILWNVFGASAGNLKVDVGGYNAVLGKSYGEIAAESRSQHKSQGFGVQKSRGEALEYFSVTGGSTPASDIFEGVTTDLSRVEGAQNLSAMIDNIITQFNFIQPQNSIKSLATLYKEILKLPDSYWKERKKAEVRTLIEQCSGLWIETFTSQGSVAQGDSLRVSFSINDRLATGAVVRRIAMDNLDTAINQTLSPNRNINFVYDYRIRENTSVTQPYWLIKPHEEGYFNIPTQDIVGQPDVDPALIATFYVDFSNITIPFERIVHYKLIDQVKGELIEPLVVNPPIVVYGNPELLLMKEGDTAAQQFTIQGTINRNLFPKSLQATAFIEKNRVLKAGSATNLVKGTQKIYNFKIHNEDAGKVPVRALTSIDLDGNRTFNLAQATIHYDHIPYINYFYNDWVKLVPIDLKTANKRVAYITGAGDKVPEALEQMGYDVFLLGEKEVAKNDLSQYDAIITGVRAFNALDWMDKYYEKLMQYVANGGNYIVQYSQANNIRGRIGPYPMVISSKRITNENAAVTFLRPDHQVMNYPNKITQADFLGWIQERSIYHASSLDSNYTTIFRMNDPNEQPDDGSLVIAKYGKGFFTYTGLVLFRELPAGVPGAYRLLANLIALNKKMEF